MIIVYTAILGDSDSLKPAPQGADRCVCFIDGQSSYPDSNGWELELHSYDGDPRREAWWLRCMPHLMLGDYDRAVWIDASFTLTNLPKLLKDAGSAPIAALRHHERKTSEQESARLVQIGQAKSVDMALQRTAYQMAGFRSKHLSISCILVRDRSEAVQQFNVTWDSEIQRHPGDNTQVSLDYSAWKHGLTIKALKGTRHVNPYATHDHEDHKKRRRPYVGSVA